MRSTLVGDAPLSQREREPAIWSAEPFATVSDGCAQIRSFWIIASGWRTEPDSQLDG
jgi:hypothetical protein